MKPLPLLLSFFLFFLVLTGCQSQSRPELHVFIWSNYIQPEAIEEFEQRHQCRIVIDTYDSNEAMYAKLKLGATGYDIISPSNYFISMMITQGMVQPLDFQKIPNATSLDPAYLKRVPKDTLPYGIPFMSGFTGIAYRKDRIPHPEHSWGIFAKKEYRGRMTLLNDLREALGAALKYLGYSPNTPDPKEINAAADVLIAWKKNIAKFESDQYKNGIASAEYLVTQGYSGDVLQIMQENESVGFFYPKEGTFMSMDYLAIPKGAPHNDLAHAFINFLLEGKIAAQDISTIYFLSPNLAAYPLLSQELRDNPILFPSEHTLQQIEMIQDVGPAYPLYLKAWEKVKAAN